MSREKPNTSNRLTWARYDTDHRITSRAFHPIRLLGHFDMLSIRGSEWSFWPANTQHVLTLRSPSAFHWKLHPTRPFIYCACLSFSETSPPLKRPVAPTMPKHKSCTTSAPWQGQIQISTPPPGNFQKKRSERFPVGFTQNRLLELPGPERGQGPIGWKLLFHGRTWLSKVALAENLT